MIKVIAKKDITINGVEYLEDEEVKITSIQQVIRLNEQGFIKPLSHKDLVLLERELKNKEVKHEF